jgi:hypothetical protein
MDRIEDTMEDKLKNIFTVFVLAGISLFASFFPAHAIPTLQVGEFENMVTAYLIPDFDTTLGDTYYLSIGVTPKLGFPGGSLGAFDISYTDNTGFHSDTIDVTSEMTYGNPGIPSHGFFDTYYIEFAFVFDPDNVVPLAFNVEDPLETNANVTMYYQEFALANYPDPDMFHVDLYNKDDVFAIQEFAPFSHDVDACCDNFRVPPPPPVPEPSSVLLLGAGLLGFIPLRRALRKKSV